MALVRGGFTPLPHVQRFADACEKATGASNYGTYNGHDPTPERALDIFVPVNSDVLGNKITDFGRGNYKRFGIWYIIYRQRIWNPSIVDRWRDMEDRGGVTQNHYDHVHVSFWANTDVDFDPPETEGGDMGSLAVRFIYKDQTPGRVGNLDYVFDGPSRIFQAVGSVGVLKACDECDMPAIGEVGQGDFEWFSAQAKKWEK